MADRQSSPKPPASSRASTTEVDDVTSRPAQHQFARLPGAPIQSVVSMFTGLSTSPHSPTMSPRSDFPSAGLSPGTVDRVFPIRSTVSIDPTATPLARHESSDGFPGFNIGIKGGISDRRAGLKKTESEASHSPPRRRTSPSRRTNAGSDTRRQSMASSAQRSAAGSVSREEEHRSSDTTTTGTATVAANLDSQLMNTILSDGAESIKSGRESLLSGVISAPTDRAVSLMSEADAPLITARFKHVVTDGGHAIITGRGGETLQRCEDEPIHIPGAIQSFGLLVAFKEEDGKLNVHIVSENSAGIIGYTPAQLFKLGNFLDIFTEEQADNLLDHLDFIRDEHASDVVANGPEVFMLSIRPPHHRTRKLWCAMHICDSDRDMIICEFEMEDDTINPLVPMNEETPEPPEDTLGSDPTPEELAESTINASKPLRVLRSARKKRGEAAAMEVFNIMSQVQEQLASAPTLATFLKVLIGVVKELSGFHRVMIYQFDQTWNGRVVAELVDPRATKDLYKGLNFPASDIPKQAREMYKVNKVRLLYDRDQETARLVCRTVEDLERPLDLTHAYLRAMSPIHLKYLTNMAVRSSMSISINAFNELWGLIACHSYGSKGMRVSFPIRKMCRLVGDTASRNIERLSYASRLQARKLINTTSSSQNPSGYIVASSEDLLKLFDADVGAISIRDETKIMGNSTGVLQELLAMVEFLRMRKMNMVHPSRDIHTDFPDLRYSPGLKSLAGVLFVPLSSGGTDFIAFFRKGALQEVKWAGNPYEKFVKEGTEGYLEPRKSFKMWSEMIVGRCRDWTEEEIETASVLCLVYGKFIDVWRQKEAALQNSQLTRLLLANSAHEVRTPLNAIINYLEIALEGTLDQDTRDNLARSHSASKSLVYVINDLLDLTKTEENNNLIKEESFDLYATIKEATDPYVGDAKRKGIEYHVNVQPDLPKKLVGDPRRVRQIVSNLIANAVQHTSEGHVTVDVGALAQQLNYDKCEVEISVADTGAGMSQANVDALFQELEEVSHETDIVAPSKLLDRQPHKEESPKQMALGLGLAVVARTIRNMNGQLRLKTEVGKGSRFIIVLSFTREQVPETSKGIGSAGRTSLIATSPGSVIPSAHSDGEVTLIRKNSRPEPGSLGRKHSADSMKSMNSLTSGKSVGSMHSNRSDADRLIDAIQEPLRLSGESGERSGGRRAVHRSVSAGDGMLPQITSTEGGLNRAVPRGSLAKIPGEEAVQDSRTSMKSIRMPDHETVDMHSDKPKPGMKVSFQSSAPTQPAQPAGPIEDAGSVERFSVLVAEDDPINSKIMKKRLEKLGHRAYMTVNGEECASAHGEQATAFDAVLMDLQMPIVDGFSSTKMIRSFEKIKSTGCLSARALHNGRVPIFAVSASLEERDREKYIRTGFDGWILKPVDFKRVDELLKGIVVQEIRNKCLYTPGKWEQGGWFEERNGQDAYQVDTQPSGEGPTTMTGTTTPMRDGSIDTGTSEGSVTPTLVPKLAKGDTV